MYLSTSTSTEYFPEMYLSTFQVLYKLYLSTDVLKYKVLLPGSGPYRHCRVSVDLAECVRPSAGRGRRSHRDYRRAKDYEASAAGTDGISPRDVGCCSCGCITPRG